VTTTELPDPSELTLEELRSLRQQLQLEDDAVSYARRVAQARLDLVKAEAQHRSTGSDAVVDEELRTVLSSHLTGGPARPPRPTEDLSDHPLAVELDEICASHGLGRLKSLDDAELSSLLEAVAAFESRVSSDRRARFERLDALSAELVRRYRDGEADVDSIPG
jgi:RsiG-like